MRIAIYGGSFNPPHRAHAMVIDWLLESGTADQVWLVPVFRHAFEASHDKVLAPFEARMRWCGALAGPFGDRVRVSDAEQHLPVPSYTIDTLDHLARRHPACQFRLVVGADILAQVDGWKSWARIAEEYTPVVVGRSGYPSPEGVPCFPEISSTVVRRQLAEGGDASTFLTPEVLALIDREKPWAE